MRCYLLIILLFINILSYGQLEKFKLYESDYSYQYLQELNKFEICLITTSQTICNQYSVPKTEYLLVELLEKNRLYFSDNNPIIQKKANEFIKSLKSLLSKQSTKTLKLESIGLKNDLIKELNQKKVLDNFISNYKKDVLFSASQLKISFITYLQKKTENRLKYYFTEKIKKQQTYELLTSVSLQNTLTTNKTIDASSNTASQTTFVSLLLDKQSIWLKLQEKFAPQNLSYQKELLVFPIGINKSEFIRSFYLQQKQLRDSDKNYEILEDLYHKIHNRIDKRKSLSLKRQYENNLSNAIDSLEAQKKTYSGILFMKDAFEVKKTIQIDSLKKSPIIEKFNIDYATIRFFNNRINDISILGSLESHPKEKIVLFNENFSYSLRELNRTVSRKEKITHRLKRRRFGTNKNKEWLFYNLSDVLEYIPDNKLNYSVKNQELKLIPNDSTKVEERQIGDYFTGVIFSDFLGINSANSNNLIVAEAKIRFPINLRSWRHWTVLDHISGSVAISLYNGFNSNSRAIKFLGEVSVHNENQVMDSLNLLLKTKEHSIENFDLLVNNNIDAAVNFSLLSLEWKQANAFIHINYGTRFLRTGVTYDIFQIDKTNNNKKFLKSASFQAFSIGHSLGTTIEIRPQTNIGADFNVGINWLWSRGTNESHIKFHSSNLGANVNAGLDLFATGNNAQKKSGIYFRFAGAYNSKTRRVFPQLMAGYATNLSSFVNKFKSDK